MSHRSWVSSQIRAMTRIASLENAAREDVTSLKSMQHQEDNVTKVFSIIVGCWILTFRWAWTWSSGSVGYHFSTRTVLRIFKIFCTELVIDIWWTLAEPDFKKKFVNPWFWPHLSSGVQNVTFSIGVVVLKYDGICSHLKHMYTHTRTHTDISCIP